MWVTATTFLIIGHVSMAQAAYDEAEVKAFVVDAEKQLQAESVKTTYASWNFESNITDETQAVSLKSQQKYDELFKKLGKQAQKYDMNKVKDEDLKRKLKMLTHIGTAILDSATSSKFNKLKADMGKKYSTAKVKEYTNMVEDYSLEPELTLAMAKSRDPDVLKYYWTQWRDRSGKQIRGMFKDYVDIYNKAAKLNGFKDASDMKVVDYESSTFKQEMEDTWQGLKPLYEQLHAYVRNKLSNFYGEKVVKKEGPIPAHILGNMWAQSWTEIADLLTPHPNKPSINVTGEMQRRNWTAQIMFEKAEDFFMSMGMEKMPKKFWEGSIIEKPKDGRDLTCHASAWDFYNGEDFRIKQCTRVNQDDFVTVNHEMGHVQYFLQYKHQPHLYRTGANPGFHEGVADILSLAVGTATYFQRLGLLADDVDVEDEETNINILFDMALRRIAFLPFGYLIDKFRWDVFSGVTSVENMNCHWWKLRHEIQGLAPPVKRSYEDFDAGSKYHVANDVGYVRYFTAFIYEFQFYRALCLKSGRYVPNDPKKPLHRCNFYGSNDAGDKLKEMLRLGASRPWKEAMKIMTGEPDMSTNALREYFLPLEKWLKKENQRQNIKVGWGTLNLDSVCKQSKVGRSSPRTSTIKNNNSANGLTPTWLIGIVTLMSVLIRY